MKTKLFTLVLITVFAVSCKSTKETDTNTNQHLSSSNMDKRITDKQWKLVELEGQEVKMAENQKKELSFMLNTKENRIQGFSGCNTFNGTYELEKGNRIHFSQLASTMMACPDVDVNESEFLKVFDQADNYNITDDTLILNVGRRAPLAVFKAVKSK